MFHLNYYGIAIIILQKIKEFFYEFQYTILSPLISTYIFVIILTTINKYYIQNNNDYILFVIPGIIIMTVMQISYQNISESLIFMKQIGSFYDYLISPISRIEVLIAFIIYSILISLFVGFINIFFLSFFYNLIIINVLEKIYYLIITSLIFSSIGAIVGFLFFTWDFQQSIYNFFIIPVSFLSGTFFSINSLNLNWQILYIYNPFYYLVTSFRNTFKEDNIYDFQIEINLFLLTILIFFISIFVFHRGYRVIN